VRDPAFYCDCVVGTIHSDNQKINRPPSKTKTSNVETKKSDYEKINVFKIGAGNSGHRARPRGRRAGSNHHKSG
jgi:hypothetical protein